MSGKNQPMRKAMALVPSREKEVAVPHASRFHRMRSAVDVLEDADAHLTGMTRSLDRRLQALNLQPSPESRFNYMKVA